MTAWSHWVSLSSFVFRLNHHARCDSLPSSFGLGHQAVHAVRIGHAGPGGGGPADGHFCCSTQPGNQTIRAMSPPDRLSWSQSGFLLRRRSASGARSLQAAIESLGATV